jgi:hypothetical protein
METSTPDLPPGKVIRWLRSPEGEAWSQERIGCWLERHFGDAGVFASVLRDGSNGALASWPDPGSAYDLGSE